MKKNFKET
jgi:hypothetical protein